VDVKSLNGKLENSEYRILNNRQAKKTEQKMKKLHHPKMPKSLSQTIKGTSLSGGISKI